MVNTFNRQFSFLNSQIEDYNTLYFNGCGACVDTPLATLPNIDKANCNFDSYKFVRLVFAIRKPDTTAIFTEANIITSSTWATKISAIDDTKITLTNPKTYGNNYTGGEQLSTTNTPTGFTRNYGYSLPTTIEFQMTGLSQEEYKQMQALVCALQTSIEGGEVMFIDVQGNTHARYVSSTIVKGFQILNLSLSSPTRSDANQPVADYQITLSVTIPSDWFATSKVYDTTAFALTI